MSIFRQQASRSTAFANRKREMIGEVPLAAPDQATLSSGSPLAGPTVQKLENQFDAVEGREARHLSGLQAASPSPLSPLSLSSTPMGPSRTTSGMSAALSHMGADSHHPLGPSTLRPLTPLSPLGQLPYGAAQHFTRCNPLAEASPFGLSTSPLTASVGYSRLQSGQATYQEESDGESGSTALAEEPYLMNNPAYEAYLDSESASPGSVESNACTTPRSAIQEQVAGSPWLGRVQTFIQGSPSSSSAPACARSAPPTVQRGAPPRIEDGTTRGHESSSKAHTSTARTLFAPGAELGGMSADRLGTSQAPAQPGWGRHTAPVSPCRDWSSVYDMPQAEQTQQAAAVVDRLHADLQRAAAAAAGSGDGVLSSPANPEVLRANAMVDRLQAGVQRHVAQLRSAQAARAAGLEPAEPGPAAAALIEAHSLPLQAAQEGGSEQPPQEEVGSEAPRVSLQSSASATAGEAAAHRGVSQQDTELKEKLGSGASLSVLASGRSEGAEHPMQTAGTPRGSAVGANPGPGVVPKTSAVRRTKGGSQLCSTLLLCFMAALLGCMTLLLAGHYMASSQDRLASLHSGTYGAAAASFGRCISQLQQPSDPRLYKSTAGGSGHSLAVEGACMYSAIRREAAVTWATAQPHVTSHVSTARTAAERAAAALGARLGPILARSRAHTARAHALATQLAEVAAKKCPACTTVTNITLSKMASLGRAWSGALTGWEAASGAGTLRPPPLSELYHDAALLRDIPRRLQSAWRTVITRVAVSAPAWAMEAAASVQERTCSVTAAWAALLEQSAAAVLPEQERLAAEQAQSSDPTGAALESGRMHAAAQWLTGWLGSGNAPSARQGEEAAGATTAPGTHDNHDQDSAVIDGEVAVEDRAADEVELPEQSPPLPATVNVTGNDAMEDQSIVAHDERSPEPAEAGVSSGKEEVNDPPLIEQQEVFEAAQPRISDEGMAPKPEVSAAEYTNVEDVQSSSSYDLVQHTAVEEAVGGQRQSGKCVEQTETAKPELPHVHKPTMQQATKAASKSAWTAALWAGASVAAAAVALLVSHYLKSVLETTNAPQETLAQGPAERQKACKSSAAVFQPDKAICPAVMDLAAHAPSPVLVRGEPEAPSQPSQRTPRGRPKKGAASTPASGSAARKSLQRTPHSAPAAGSGTEPRATRGRSRFAETPELRKTPRANAYPGPWQE
ncbi:g2921 [Coccomyxa elongata]